MRIRVNCRKHLFAVPVINVWNSLPDEVVSTNQLSRFKTHIRQINLNNFLIGKAWLVVLLFFYSPQSFWCYLCIYVFVFVFLVTCKCSVTTLRRPCGIEYCGCVYVCFMPYFNVLFICLQNIWIWIIWINLGLTYLALHTYGLFRTWDEHTVKNMGLFTFILSV